MTLCSPKFNPTIGGHATPKTAVIDRRIHDTAGGDQDESRVVMGKGKAALDVGYEGRTGNRAPKAR